jgi:hypothetical protein
MANFYHLDLSGGKQGFARPTYWVLNDRAKELVGPFRSEASAKEYRGALGVWPTPRIITGCTTYGLDSAHWQDSLGAEWVRIEPPYKFSD